MASLLGVEPEGKIQKKKIETESSTIFAILSRQIGYWGSYINASRSLLSKLLLQGSRLYSSARKNLMGISKRQQHENWENWNQ